MNRRAAALIAVVPVLGLFAGCAAPAASNTDTEDTSATLTISLSRFPHVADHARDAMAAGESSICTIDRPGAGKRRTDSLRGIATAKGQDRDEFPPAVCKEGGKGADVRLVPSSENRSEGAWMSGQLKKWPNGTRIKIAVGS